MNWLSIFSIGKANEAGLIFQFTLHMQVKGVIV